MPYEQIPGQYMTSDTSKCAVRCLTALLAIGCTVPREKLNLHSVVLVLLIVQSVTPQPLSALATPPGKAQNNLDLFISLFRVQSIAPCAIAKHERMPV